MRIIGCGLLTVAALLGPAPVAVAGELADADPAVPQAEVSMLALSLTAGGAIAAVGSGVALAVARRREVGPPGVGQPGSGQPGSGQRGISPASRRSG